MEKQKEEEAKKKAEEEIKQQLKVDHKLDEAKGLYSCQCPGVESNED